MPAKMNVGRAVLAVSFALYIAHLASGLYLRDSGELTTAAFTLGVAHETGFPLYCLMGKLASLVPLGDVATRLAALSAAAGALAAWLVYRLAREIGGGDRVAEAAAVGGAALLVCGLTFWKSSTVPEVYAPTAAALALALHLAWRASSPGGDARAGVMLALVGGLSFGLHTQLRLLVGPPCIVWALVRLRRGDRWPLSAPAALAVGLAVVAYLPLRAARHPAANWGDPETLVGVARHLSGARIRSAFAAEMLTGDVRLLGAHLAGFFALVEGQLGLLALVAAAAGLAWSWRRARLVAVLLACVLVGDALYSAWLNPMALDDLQDGAPTALALALAAALGVQAAARRFGRAAPWAAGALATVLVVPAALDALPAKRGLGSEAAVWARAALAAAPARALVLTTSDDLSAGLAYEQSVAGARPDVAVVTRQHLADPTLLPRTRGGVHVGRALGRLIADELPRRAILWEPSSDAPPGAALEPGVPLYRVVASPAPLPPARPLAARVEELLAPGRDPMVRQLAARALTDLGASWLGRGDDLHAGALFEAALGVRHNDAAAATNLAVVRARRGDFAGALALVEGVLAREPRRKVARINAARYRLALGDRDGAARELARAHRDAPGDPEIARFEQILKDAR
jgi:hypothetical protein